MAEDESRSQLDRLVSLATTFIAPATLISTLLFYFGYVSARAQYSYFGIDVDTVGLGTQDYVMRSPQPLLVPVLVLTLVGLAGIALHNKVNRRLAEVEAADRRAHWLRRAVVTRSVGLGLLSLGVLILFGYPYLKSWPAYPLATPLLLVLAVVIVGYGARLVTRLGGPRPPRQQALLLLVVLVANVFWATATVAQWSGRALAHDGARHLDRLPSVILDTKERLFLRDGQVTESALPAAAGQTFRFRYRGLRLLIEGKDRMFLVPQRWSASDSTLVVPLDASVRVQFQFVNEKP